MYLSADEFLDLERARLALRAHGIGVDRGRLVREAIALLIMDLETGIDASAIARRLHSPSQPGPASGGAANGAAGGGSVSSRLADGAVVGGAWVNGGPVNGGVVNGGPVNGGVVNGGPVSGAAAGSQ